VPLTYMVLARGLQRLESLPAFPENALRVARIFR
jgi:hypothetical protein